MNHPIPPDVRELAAAIFTRLGLGKPEASDIDAIVPLLAPALAGQDSGEREAAMERNNQAREFLTRLAVDLDRAGKPNDARACEAVVDDILLPAYDAALSHPDPVAPQATRGQTDAEFWDDAKRQHRANLRRSAENGFRDPLPHPSPGEDPQPQAEPVGFIFGMGLQLLKDGYGASVYPVSARDESAGDTMHSIYTTPPSARQAIEALGHVISTLSFPVSTEIEPRGWSLQSPNEDRNTFAVEEAMRALTALKGAKP